jgi:hypothetical protein
VAAFAGGDLYRRYRHLGQPWIWWTQVGTTLTAGEPVWHDDPGQGPGREFADVAGPYLTVASRVAVIALAGLALTKEAPPPVS